MIEQNVVSKYISGMSMRAIGVHYDTNHKVISKILKKNNIKTRLPIGKRKNKFTTNRERQYNNMATHLRFSVNHKWLMQFEDFDKLKLLNNVITKRRNRYDVDTEWYKSYIEKFYDDEQFNSIYLLWVGGGKTKYQKPSIDHIISKAYGGSNCIDNIQFLSWFENRCKNDMSQHEWDKIKNNIDEYFI